MTSAFTLAPPTARRWKLCAPTVTRPASLSALASLDADFDRLCSAEGRPSIAPERLMRASLVQFLFSVRSERQLMEQMQYNTNGPFN